MRFQDGWLGRLTKVSPTSIRSRILKVGQPILVGHHSEKSFTHVDPFEDTERLQPVRRTKAS